MASPHDKSISKSLLFTLVVLAALSAVTIAASLEAQHPGASRSMRRAPASRPLDLPDRLPDLTGPFSPHGRPDPRPPARRPHEMTSPARCACDQRRFSKVEDQIADLVRRMAQQDTRNTENDDAIRRLENSNRQLQSQVVRENQRLMRLTNSLRSRSDSLADINRQLRAENARLLTERDRLQADVDQSDRSAERLPTDAVPMHRSAMLEPNDVIGNREAELIEMGIFPPVGPRPDERPAAVPSSRQLDTERLATSLLEVNQENANLAKKIEQLEGRLNRQATRGVFSGPQFRPSSGESSELADKISRLERLVLVALQSPSDPANGPSGEYQGRPLPDQPGPAGPNSRLVASAKQPVPPAAGLAVSRMSDDDLEAMAEVVDSVQNKSPRKCAFSVASTEITVGISENPLAIQFDHEFVNKGGDFKMRRGRFVCEHPGFYYITFTLRSYDGKYLGVALMKNEELQTAVYADSSHRNVMQTQSMVVHLEPGDELWLRHAPSDSFAVHSGEHRFVTFSGFLIFRGY